jgi:uncharacterized low-complexity protein
MKRLFVTPFLTALSPLLLAGLVLAPVADAGSASSTRTRTGSGGGSATKTRTASGSGGSGSATTTRTATGSGGQTATKTRSTSVNNVNNVNVNRHTDVDVHVDDHHSAWDDHPVATAAAVTGAVAVTAAVIGSIVYTPPPNCVPVNVGGVVYQQCGSTWYQPQYVGTQVQYVVIAPPR